MSLFGADGQQRPRPCAFQRDRSILRNRSQLSLNGVFDREIRVIWGTGAFASKLLLNRYRIERGRKIEKNWENALATILLIGNTKANDASSRGFFLESYLIAPYSVRKRREIAREILIPIPTLNNRE